MSFAYITLVKKNLMCFAARADAVTLARACTSKDTLALSSSLLVFILYS